LATAAAVIASGQARGNAYNDAVLASNPLYYWTFDEAGSANAVDSVVAGGAADDLVAQAVGSTRVASTTTPGGINLGNAVTGGRYQAADLSGAGIVTTYAIEFWVDLDSTTSGYVLSFDANTPAVIANYSGAGQIELFGTGRTNDGGTPPTLDQNWHHVVVGRNSTSHTFYVDGVSAGTYTVGNPANTSNQLKLTVLGSNAADLLNGKIDELAFYSLDPGTFNTQLASIAAHYNVTAVPEPASLGLLTLGGLALLRRRRA
jgi:hypothetical protein